MVVDRLTKYVHFIALSHPYSTSKVAALFVQHVFKLHGSGKYESGVVPQFLY